MTTTERRQAAWSARFRDELIRPCLVLVMIAGTIAQWPSSRILYPAFAMPMFVLAAIAAAATLLPWTRLSERQRVAAMGAYMVFGSLLLPLVHDITTAVLFPYIAASVAGEKLTSRRAAVGIAMTGAAVAVVESRIVDSLVPDASSWPWWVALTVCLPVYIGVSERERIETMRSAQLAAEEARRAADSESREAALGERSCIAGEIHDVLGHSLSGIALQLDMADALHAGGRAEEATAAVRKARALAVDSIGETRNAVHALREDTLPLEEALRQLAEQGAAGFEVTGQVGPIGAESVHTIIRAAQEALTNAAKYAPGGQRSVRLAFTADRITLTVCNGRSSEPEGTEPAGGTGLGLTTMRERTARLGGTLRAGPATDNGWAVELELPR